MLRALVAALALLCGVAHGAPAPVLGQQANQAFQVWPLWTASSPPPKPPPPRAYAQPVATPSQQQPTMSGSNEANPNQVAPAIGRLASPGRPAVTPLPTGARRVCVFDFDDTLKNGAPPPSQFCLASACAQSPFLLASAQRAESSSCAEGNVVANDAAWVVQAWCVDDVSRGRLGLGADFCSSQRGARLRGGHRHSRLPP
jgi:hypothetical protein